jgi:hypothetical protein
MIIMMVLSLLLVLYAHSVLAALLLLLLLYRMLLLLAYCVNTEFYPSMMGGFCSLRKLIQSAAGAKSCVLQQAPMLL